MIIRKAEVSDAISLQGRLRRQDYNEVWAAHGHDPNEVLVVCAQYSTLLWCAEVNGDVAAVFGVAPSRNTTDEGQPWLLGAEELQFDAKAFLRLPAEIIPRMQRVFPVLRNLVDARNTQSIRWLRRIGFTVADKPVPYGPFGLPFYSFCKE